MFIEVYKNLKEGLERNQIEDINFIRNTFEAKIRESIVTYYPHYKNHLGSTEDFFKEISLNMAGRDSSKADIYYKKIETELNSLIRKWKLYMNSEDIIRKLSDIMTNSYCNSIKKQEYSLDDAVIDTLNRNIELGTVIDSDERLRTMLERLFEEYFYKNNTSYFTSKNGARNYIISMGKDKILEEMKKTCKFDSSVSDEIMERSIISNYVSNLVLSLKRSEEKENDNTMKR